MIPDFHPLPRTWDVIIAVVQDLLTPLIALSPPSLLRVNSVTRETCAKTMGLTPLPYEAPTDPESQTEGLLVEFAEQFSADVSAVTSEQRSTLMTAFGAEVLGIAALMFVADFGPRVAAGLAALGVPVREPEAWDSQTHPADALLNRFTSAVGALRGLDPLTTEIIRLRGATQHNCRLCTSLRETGALEAGGSEPLYAEISQYEESSELSAAHKAALRYVDALVWTPSSLDDAAAGVLAHWSVEQAVEITLDVMRNATNKIAVAMGGDAPRVADGVEHYRLGADGMPVFG